MRSHRSPAAFDQTELLLDLAREITSSLDLQKVLDESLDALGKLVLFQGGSIQLVDRDSIGLAAARPKPTPEALEVRIPVGQGVGGLVVSEGEAIYCCDITVDERVHREGRSKATSKGVRSWFGAPLIAGGETIGLVQIDSPLIDAFTAETRNLVLAFVPTIAAAVQNARIYDREHASFRKLQEAERLKSDFLAMVSHELRTPLTSVMGFALTIAAHIDELQPERVKEFAQRIMGAGRRLEQLIQGLLDLSTMERDWQRPLLLPVDVETICRDAADEFSSGRHEIRVEIESPLPSAIGDPAVVKQILRHLLHNACKFSPGGSTVTVCAEETGGTIELSVHDQGKGIPEEILPRVFERFFQVEPTNTRTTGGLGIGLYLVKMLADRLSASVDVTSEVGRGSSFRLKLRVPPEHQGAPV